MSEFVAPGIKGNGCDAEGWEGWVQTRYGGGINVLNPTVDMIRIEDIAHSLGMQVRFTGHTVEPYTVAEHSILCSRHLQTLYPDEPDLHLVALLHDASEAYLADMARPVKRHMTQYMGIEDKLMRVVGEKYGIDLPSNDDRMKYVDSAMLATEKSQVMPKETFPWCDLPKPLNGVQIECWPWYLASSEFLGEFRMIQVRRGE